MGVRALDNDFGDIAVVGWAQTEMVRHTDKSETQLLMEVITDVLTGST